MRIDCRSDWEAYREAFPYGARVIDMNTGDEIKEKIFYADDIAGEYEYYVTNAKGQFEIRHPQKPGKVVDVVTMRMTGARICFLANEATSA